MGIVVELLNHLRCWLPAAH